MRILRLCFAILFVGLLVQEVHAAAAAAKTAGKKKKGPKVITRVDTLKRTDTLKTVDTLKKVDTLTMQNRAEVDSLSRALGVCRAVSAVIDSQLGVARSRAGALGKSLDSTRLVAKDLSIRVERQKDSARVLDSLRKVLAPDTALVLFLPVSYDTVRHPGDSSLARSLTKSLHAAGLATRQFALYVPKGNEQRCSQPECWSGIAQAKGAGQILTGTLSYSGDTLIYTSWMTSLVAGQVTRQSQVEGLRGEKDPSARMGRISSSQLFGLQDATDEEKRSESPLWRRLMLLGIFGVFAGTVVALSW